MGNFVWRKEKKKGNQCQEICEGLNVSDGLLIKDPEKEGHGAAKY